jgi:hypothetical protein
MTEKNPFSLLMPVFSPPLMTLPVEKYRAQYNILKKCTEKFCGMTAL